MFKREYYEQRIATQKQLSEELKTDNNKSLEKEKEVLSVKVTNDVDTISEKVDMVGTTENADTISLDRIDTDEIREFKPMNHGMEMLETPIPDMESGQTSPFHVSYQSYQSCEELPQESYGMTGNGRPNLYLYSPSNNTLIPCEEIIIPNPVVSTETGETAGYTGPTNIYLAYPVQVESRVVLKILQRL